MKKHAALFFTCVLLLGLTACGQPAAEQPTVTAAPAADIATSAPAAEETPAPTPEATADPLEASSAFADLYLHSLTIRTALVEDVNIRVECSNAALESEYPEAFFMNSSYLMLVYEPFSTACAEMIANAVITGSFDNGAAVSCADGVYSAAYPYIERTYTSADEYEETERSALLTWQFTDNAYCASLYLDGGLQEYAEFVDLGNDMYYFSTLTDRAVVCCSGSQVSAFDHIRRISEPALGSFPGDLRPYGEADMLFPVGTDSLSSDENTQYVLTLRDNTLVYTGKIIEDQLNNAGEKIGIVWHEIEPITLLK